jgi:4-carboxymuconolactone decarboxylase
MSNNIEGRIVVTTALWLFLLSIAPAQAEDTKTVSAGAAKTVEVTRSGSLPSAKGPAANFTGSVRADPLFRAEDPSRVSGGLVTFEPGARSAWHTHPLGQILIVTAGLGLVQQWGGPIQEIRPGDVVRIPPGVKHWHGATATTGMSHIAIQEWLDGKNVDWLEQVSSEQYQVKSIVPQN